MLRIAHLTDPHVTAPEHRLCGLDTPSLLRQALNEVNRAPNGRYDAVVITGDLAHHGEDAAYDEFKRCLAACTVPVYLCIGNHDDRARFRRAFADERRYNTGDFVQYVVEDIRRYRLVMLDTNLAGTSRGLLCEVRLSWLDESLGERPETPTLLFIHHPPFTTHIRALDAIGLDGIDALAAVVARHPQVVSIHAGHVHRTIHARLGPTPAITAAATCYHMALDFHSEDLAVTYEPPSFTMILADGETVLCHTVYFTMSDSVRLPYGHLRDYRGP